MNKHTARRKRRRAKLLMTKGKKAVRRHKRIGGRTGSIFEKRTKAKRAGYKTSHPNPPYRSIGADEQGPN